MEHRDCMRTCSSRLPCAKLDDYTNGTTARGVYPLPLLQNFDPVPAVQEALFVIGRLFDKTVREHARIHEHVHTRTHTYTHTYAARAKKDQKSDRYTRRRSATTTAAAATTVTGPGGRGATWCCEIAILPDCVDARAINSLSPPTHRK